MGLAMSEESPQMGAVLAGAYRIVDTIAIGGSGTVYHAEKLDSGDSVAVKLMHAEHPEGDVERKRFSREAEIIKQLAHQHVVRVLDYGHSADGMPFLVFPLLEGRTLKERLQDDGGLSWAEVGRLSIQTLSALDRAHRLGIVHRDIKPANMFLCKSPVGESVKILDFGLARAVQVIAGAELTRTGAVLGTPRYMAPEQVRGEAVGQTADIYSFGLVMCEMLLGHPLVRAAAELDVYMVHGADKPLELPVDVMRTPFAAVIRRAVAKPLEVRYRSAGQMLADLRAIADLMNKDRMLIASPDMEATHVMDSDAALPIKGPTQMSEELRSVFNAMVERDDDQAPVTTPRVSIEHAPPTLTRGADDGPPTLVRAVTGETDDPPPSSDEAPSKTGDGEDEDEPETLVGSSQGERRETLVDEEEGDGRETLVDEEEGDGRETLVDEEEDETLVDEEEDETLVHPVPGKERSRLSTTTDEEPVPPTLASSDLLDPQLALASSDLMDRHLDGPPTLPRAVPPSSESVPLLLTRQPLDELETVRIKLTKESAARLASKAVQRSAARREAGQASPQPPVDQRVVPLPPAFDPAALDLAPMPRQRRVPVGLVLLILAAMGVVLLYLLAGASG
jgi:serine/threonine protein kinase